MCNCYYTVVSCAPFSITLYNCKIKWTKVTSYCLWSMVACPVYSLTALNLVLLGLNDFSLFRFLMPMHRKNETTSAIPLIEWYHTLWTCTKSQIALRRDTYYTCSTYVTACLRSMQQRWIFKQTCTELQYIHSTCPISASGQLHTNKMGDGIEAKRRKQYIYYTVKKLTMHTCICTNA